MSARSRITGGLRVLAFVAVLSLLIVVPAQSASNTAPPEPNQFKITLTTTAADGIAALGLKVPVTGRLYLIITRNSSSEPRSQIDVTGVPFWGVDVQGLAGGGTVFMGSGQQQEIGYPLARLSDIPEGDYYVQAFLDVYTTFHRADGKVIQMHKDTGSGQRIFQAPGNAYSQAVSTHIGKGRRVSNLSIDTVIPPTEPVPARGVLEQGNPVDTPYVKYIKMKSNLVSRFWGQDMYIGANVLLPAGYDDPANANVRYPVIYQQGHFPGATAPFSFTPTNAFGRFWLSTSAPRFIAIQIRHATPFYDTSYAVNSANSGPYGDAIVNELIPGIDRRFRTIAEPWARVVAGSSTGGWEAAASKIWYPDVFGHAWAWSPDPVDFHYYQIANIYDATNAYFAQYEWENVELPSAREVSGWPDFTIKQENYWELALGPNTRSYQQWAAWEATWSPSSPNGYPARIWDPFTGQIDPAVAQYWQVNWDINAKLQREWSTLAPKLQGQLHFTVGDADNYFFNEAVHLLDAASANLDPPANFTFEYGARRPHGWRGASPSDPSRQITYQEWLVVAASTIAGSAPAGAPMTWRQAAPAPGAVPQAGQLAPSAPAQTDAWDTPRGSAR